MTITKMDCAEVDLHTVHFSLYQARRGFYSENGWCLQPNQLNEDPYYPDVILPRIDFTKLEMPSVDNNCGYEQKMLFVEQCNELVKLKEFINYGANSQKSSNTTTAVPIIHIEDIISKTMCRLLEVFPNFGNKEYFFQVGVSKYGTYGSNSVINPKKSSDAKTVVQIRLRNDQPVETISELVTSAFVKSQHNGSWHDQEATVDYITNHILGNSCIPGTIERFSKVDTNFLKASREFANIIGLPNGQHLTLSDDSGKIYYRGQTINDILSPYEFELLRLLIKKRYVVATFDEIAETIYKSHCDERFTFWGITKNVQRLRQKLLNIDLPRNTVQNIRGVGFKLTI